MPRTLEVHIENQGPPEVGPTVSRYRQDQIEWVSDSDTDIEIIFKESPFRASRFTVPAGASVSSGPVGPNVEKGFYEYTVQRLGGEQEAAAPLDPKVFVDD
ncbi:MAG: hypothetical protein ACYSVY_27285 [Planctomycetota bacterium]